MTDDSEKFAELQDAVEDASDLSSIANSIISEMVLFNTDWTVETIITQIDKNNIILNPRWQRRDAWDIKKKTDLIESIMLNFPVPPIVLAELPGARGRYLVLDGKQRLLTLRQFFEGDAGGRYGSFRAKNPSIIPEIHNHNRETMQGVAEFSPYLTAFDNYPLRTVIVRNWRDENVLYRIFLRLNAGSAKLYPQELRQALHPGPFIDFIEDYVPESDATRDIFGYSHPDFRMRDNELLIRYIGFATDAVPYKGNLKQFLDEVVHRINSQWDDRFDEVRYRIQDMEMGHSFAKEVFGRNVYLKWNSQSYERQFNRAIFDIIAYTFSFSEVRNLLFDQAAQIEDLFKRLCSDDVEFRRSIEVTTKSLQATQYRFERWCAGLNELARAEIVQRPAVI